MKRIGFRMQLNPGVREEYRRRHDAIWPRLTELLKETGIEDYSIFHDEATDILFAVMKVKDPGGLKRLPDHPVMREWWSYMKDLMLTHEDGEPVSIPLDEVFHMD
jgi:L-rhamnose mutarotase